MFDKTFATHELAKREKDNETDVDVTFYDATNHARLFALHHVIESDGDFGAISSGVEYHYMPTTRDEINKLAAQTRRYVQPNDPDAIHPAVTAHRITKRQDVAPAVIVDGQPVEIEVGDADLTLYAIDADDVTPLTSVHAADEKQARGAINKKLFNAGARDVLIDWLQNDEPLTAIESDKADGQSLAQALSKLGVDVEAYESQDVARLLANVTSLQWHREQAKANGDDERAESLAERIATMKAKADKLRSA